MGISIKETKKHPSKVAEKERKKPVNRLYTMRIDEGVYRYSVNHGTKPNFQRVADYLFCDVCKRPKNRYARLCTLRKNTELKELVIKLCTVLEVDANYLFGIERQF